MARDFIVDFETLGTADSAVLLSIGVLACPENDEPNENFLDIMKSGIHLKINREEQIKLKRTIDPLTIEWWKKQGDSAKDVLSSDNCCSMIETYVNVVKFFNSKGYDNKKSKIWTRGMIDQRWWQSFVKSLSSVEPEIKDPFPYWVWRDTRTVLDLLTGNINGTTKEPTCFIKHNALCDCTMDFLRLKEAFSNV